MFKSGKQVDRAESPRRCRGSIPRHKPSPRQGHGVSRCAGISSLLLLLARCSYVNRPLNDGSVLLENRVKNHTLSETFAELQPLNEHNLSPSPTTRPEISATSSPVIAQ